MSLITRRLKQYAVHWPKIGQDNNGKPQYGSAVQIRVRWEEKLEEVVDARGTTLTSRARVGVVSTDGVNIQDKLMLGQLLSSTLLDPFQKNAWEVVHTDDNPNIRATETRRDVYLA